jgi:hypothetical protein
MGMGFVTRWRRLAAGCLLGGALTVPLGPTTTGRAVDQINRQSSQPVGSVPARGVPRSDQVWVADRLVTIAGESSPVLVPGHWERRIGDREFDVPALTIFRPSTGTYETVPGGVRGPAETRPTP